MQPTEMKFLRGMGGKTSKDTVSNKEIRSRTRMVRFQDRIEAANPKWYGQIMIMGEKRVPRKVFLEKLTGMGPRGRSPKYGQIR